MPDDLVEEVGRMIGYSSIEPQPPLVPCAPSFDPPEREFLRNVRRMMVAQGFTEVSNYSFISEGSHTVRLRSARSPARAEPHRGGAGTDADLAAAGMYRNIVENAKHFDTSASSKSAARFTRAAASPKSSRT